LVNRNLIRTFLNKKQKLTVDCESDQPLFFSMVFSKKPLTKGKTHVILLRVPKKAGAGLTGVRTSASRGKIN